MREYTLYYDTTAQLLRDSGGAAASDVPYIRYQEEIRLNLHLVTDSALTQDTTLAAETISCEAVVDNDWDHWIAGTTVGELSGAITEITVSGLSEDPQETGLVQIENPSGEEESVDYTAISENSDGSWTLTVSDMLTYTYADGSTARVAEPVLCRSESADIDTTDKATGIIVVDLDADTEPFRDAAQGIEEISACGFELQIRNASAELIYVVQFSFSCFNLRDDRGAIPAPASGNYYTKAEVDALLADQAQMGNLGSDDVDSSSGADPYADGSIPVADGAGGVTIVQLFDDSSSPEVLASLLPDFVGDTDPSDGSGGTRGAVPAPANGDGEDGKVLAADGTWKVPTHLNPSADIAFNSHKITGLATPTADADAATKAYADALIDGLDWQESVLDRADPTDSSFPGSHTTGDRYIATADDSGEGWSEYNIYEWDGTGWDEIVPNEGYCCRVEDENIDYVFNGSEWVSKATSTVHNDLAGLDGGTTSEYYHLTSDQHTRLTGDGSINPDSSIAEGDLAYYDGAQWVNVPNILQLPNILINTNGREIINQRGVADGSSVSDGDFIVDRWFVEHDCTTVSAQIENAVWGVQVDDATSGSYCRMKQEIEYEHFVRTQLTVTLRAYVYADNPATLKIDDGVSSSTSAAHSGTEGSEYLEVTHTLNSSMTKFDISLELGTISFGKDARLHWAQLNVGSVAAKWTPPDPNTERMRIGYSVLSMTEATIDDAVDTPEFGKWHKVSNDGSSTQYTVTLPDPSGNAGKLLGLYGDTSTNLTRFVRINPYDDETIGGLAFECMHAEKVMLLKSDGTNWQVLYKTNPLVASEQLDLDNSMSAATINDWIACLPRDGVPGATLTVQFADGTYTIDETLLFEGFSVVLNVFGNDDDDSQSTTKEVHLDGSAYAGNVLEVRGCRYVGIYYMKVSVNSNDDWHNGISAYLTDYCIANYCYVVGNGTASGRAFMYSQFSGGDVLNSLITSTSRAINSAGLSDVRVNNIDDTGTQPAYGLYAQAGDIRKSGTIDLNGSTADEYETAGGQILSTP